MHAPGGADAVVYVEGRRDELVQLARLVDERVLRPIVDVVMPPAEAREAYRPRSRRGKVVLRVA